MCISQIKYKKICRRIINHKMTATIPVTKLFTIMITKLKQLIHKRKIDDRQKGLVHKHQQRIINNKKTFTL